ncbi:dopamine beta hydroxylase [Penaeus vannamei]|uniref:Dopamine beta hydroxylase n=1 Tax=Penaeus vannamei TaxID=6689 RepID=A0A423UAC7_PENVA|nr:dopamine beta hydroxylase [Penaeus vannamei]
MAQPRDSPWPCALLAVALLTTAPALAEGVAGANRVPGLTLTQTVRAEQDLGPLLDLKHSHESILDSEGIDLNPHHLTPHYPQEVTFEIHARTLGWLGFGFSSSGGMRGSDILIAWVKDGEAFAQDRYGVGNRVPVLDDHPDWELLGGRENGTHTTIVVKRAINTCDEQDFRLTNETVRFIYAYDSDDPPEDGDIYYHGPRRGNRFALVLLPFHHKEPTPDIQTWEISQRVPLPNGVDTFYWCHIEKFSMIYGENSRAHLHHTLGFECNVPDGRRQHERYVGHEGYECYTPNMPPDFNYCEKFLINWAIGSEGEMLPDNVGFPLGEDHGGSTYLLFQTHYDNARYARDIAVEWGMKIYYTDKIREKDAGNLAVGHSIVFSLTVPPRRSDWVTAGHCSSDCTRGNIPEDGVNVFMIFLHGHYTECHQDSRDRPNATFAGWGARDEMCHAFLSMWPRIPMAACRSSPHLETLRDAWGIKSFPSDLDLYKYEFDPWLGNQGGINYQKYINGLSWDKLNLQKINEKLRRGLHVNKCQYNYGMKIEMAREVTKYPSVPEYVEPVESKCRGTPAASLSSVNGVGSPNGPALLGTAVAFLWVLAVV